MRNGWFDDENYPPPYTGTLLVTAIVVVTVLVVTALMVRYLLV